MKWLKRIVLTVVILLIVCVITLYLARNHLVRTAVQTQASDSLNVPTTLGSAEVALFGGQLTLGNLDIGSPPGFSAPNMFTLNKIGVGVHYGDLRADPVRIESISIDGPVLIIEQNGGKLNFQTLMNQPFKTPAAAPAAPPTAERAEGQPVRLIIGKLDVTNAIVEIHPGQIPGLGQTMKDITLKIPSVSLQNIGNSGDAQNGVAIKDVVMQVITALADKATNDASVPSAFKTLLTSNISDVQKQLRQQLSQQLGGLTKQLPGNVGNLISGDKGNGGIDLGGILGNKKGKKPVSTQP